LDKEKAARASQVAGGGKNSFFLPFRAKFHPFFPKKESPAVRLQKILNGFEAICCLGNWAAAVFFLLGFIKKGRPLICKIG
jgi:hypothetical protein